MNIVRGLAASFSGVDARLKELIAIKKSEWTPQAEDGIRSLLLNLKEVSDKANGYATQLRAVLKNKKEAEKQADRFFKFIGIRDQATATRAYKAAIKEAHPDNGGDTNGAALVNAAWDDYKKQNGWTNA